MATVKPWLSAGFLCGCMALAWPAAAAVWSQDTRQKDSGAITIKRRHDFTDEDLRKQLLTAPEVGFDQSHAAALYAPFRTKDAKGKGVQLVLPDLGPRLFNTLGASAKATELTALPWRSVVDSQLGKEPAEALHVISVQLRSMLREAVPAGDVRPDAAKLSAWFERGLRNKGIEIDPEQWLEPEAVPALNQLLQAENTATRLVLVDRLSRIEGKDAGVALAQRAVFDLAPSVREKAVQALAARPAKEYQQILLDGLRWPWAAVSDHAAEAIVALKLKDMLPKIVDTLKQPPPVLPFTREVNGKDKYFVREAVRINHLCNCMLCHAPSLTKDDLVRGSVPFPGQEPPPAYSDTRDGVFVRADFTFLKQDFSVVQPVAIPGKWAGQQRYDYLVRERPLTAAETKTFIAKKSEIETKTAYPQRDAALFVLREMTQADAGVGYEDWAKMLGTFIEKK